MVVDGKFGYSDFKCYVEIMKILVMYFENVLF